MQSLAQSWLVYSLTHSAAMLGAVAFAGQIPTLLLGPLAGVAADRHPRWLLVVVSQAAAMVFAFLLAVLTLTHTVHIAHVFVIAIAVGVVNAFEIPARQSFLVEMVGREDLMNAIALNSSMFNATRLVGPALAGFLLGWIGVGGCFLINGLSFLAVLAGLFLMSPIGRQARPATAGVIEHTREGLAYVRAHPALWRPLLLVGLTSLTSVPYLVLLPIFADQVLHGGPRGLGMLMSGSGLGALLAALLMAGRDRLRGIGAFIGWAPVGLGASLLVFTLSRNLGLSMLLIVPAGFFTMMQLTSTNTILQSMVEDRMRGRLMSIYSMMLLGLAPVGSLLAGLAAQAFGAPWTVRVGGVLTALGGLLFLRGLPTFRAMARGMLEAREMERRAGAEAGGTGLTS